MEGRNKVNKRIVTITVLLALSFLITNFVSFSTCDECTHTIVVFEDNCTSSCISTKYWWQGHACCDFYGTSADTCEKHLGVAQREDWSLSGGYCAGTYTEKCSSSTACSNIMTYSKVSFDSCDLVSLIGRGTNATSYCGSL